LDALIEDKKDLVKRTKLNVSKNSAGYNLADVKQKDGSFDLTPLIVGSQGTLGIVTEAIIETESFNPHTTLVVGVFQTVDEAAKASMELKDLSATPSAIEMVDDNLLNFIDKTNPNQLKGLLEKPYGKVVLLVEFDDANIRVQKRMTKKARKIMENYDAKVRVETEPEQQEQLWKIRHAAASVAAFSEGGARALPIIEDGIVPLEKLNDYIEGIYGIFQRHQLTVALWGHAGNANLHIQPLLDLAQLGDRQKIFKLMDEYTQLVISLGGSISAEHGDGRLRGPYLSQLYGQEVYEIFSQVRKIFDPYGTLNPGVKTGVTVDDIKPLLRSEYSLMNIYDHMPRT